MLSWDGVALRPMVLLGRRVIVVAQLIDDVRELRIDSGRRSSDRPGISVYLELAHNAASHSAID